MGRVPFRKCCVFSELLYDAWSLYEFDCVVAGKKNRLDFVLEVSVLAEFFKKYTHFCNSQNMLVLGNYN